MSAARVLLVGGGGAVGRALLARWPAGLEPPLVWDRVLPSGCEGTALDLCNPAAVAAAAQSVSGPVHLVQLAASLTIRNDPEALRQSIDNNVAALLNPATALADRITTLTHLSSISVYGAAEAFPVREDAPLRPTTAYGIGKAAAEAVGEGLARLRDWRHCTLRATQLFGLESARDALPHLLVRRMSAGEPITLSADPASLRDYLHVDDAVAVLVRQCEAPREGTYNLGSGAPVPLRALFAAAARRWGRDDPSLSATGGPRVDQHLDIARARAAFGWAPERGVLEWLGSADPAGSNG